MIRYIDRIVIIYQIKVRCGPGMAEIVKIYQFLYNLNLAWRVANICTWSPFQTP